MRHVAEAVGVALPIDAPHERSTKARNGRRALKWREQLERDTGAAMERAHTFEQRDAVEAAHAEEVALGPDWPKIRRGSEYRTPAACRDRNALARLLVYFTRLEREKWTKDRAVANHEARRVRRSIGRTVRPVLVALIGLARRFEHVFPSLERLASLALCSRRAVVTALATLGELGLVVVHRRRKRIVTALGMPREAQATNCYQIIEPAGIEAHRPRVSASIERPARLESAKRAQQSGPQISAEQRESPIRPAGDLATRVGDWRSRTRALLDATVRHVQCRER